MHIHFNSNPTLLFNEQKLFFPTAVKKIIFNDDVTRTVKNFTHYNERIAVNKWVLLSKKYGDLILLKIFKP